MISLTIVNWTHVHMTFLTGNGWLMVKMFRNISSHF